MRARFEQLANFSVVPGALRWPWFSFSPNRSAIAYTIDGRVVAIRTLDRLTEERRIELPEAFAVPTIPASDSESTSRQGGLHALAVHPASDTIVALAWHEGRPLACIAGVGCATSVHDLSVSLGELGPMAASFTTAGDAIWLSAESGQTAALLRLRYPDLAVVGRTAFEPAPPPVSHELFVHPSRDEAMLLMPCGQDGTFVRCVRFDGEVKAIANELEGGTAPTGFADWSSNGDEICFVGDAGIDLRRWPTLERRRVAQMPEGLVQSWAGIQIGEHLLVAANEEDDEPEHRVLVFGASTLQQLVDAPAPRGMWAGRLGEDLLVTIDHTREASHAASIHRVKLGGSPTRS